MAMNETIPEYRGPRTNQPTSLRLLELERKQDEMEARLRFLEAKLEIASEKQGGR
jgi:hypothetical protein